MSLGLNPVGFAGCQWIVCKQQMNDEGRVSVKGLTHDLRKPIAQRKGDRRSLALLVQDVRYPTELFQKCSHHVAVRDDLRQLA